MPKLSLAIAGKSPFDPAPFWAALIAQGPELLSATEIIVAHDRDAPLQDGGTNALQLAMPGASVFALWGAAAAEASSDYLAVLDMNAPLRPGWLAAMLKAIEGGGSAYHGPVEVDYPADDPRSIGYLVEYVQFHPPVAPDMAEISGNNLVLRRSALPSRHDLRASGFTKTALLKDLRSVARVPQAVVVHRKPFDARHYIGRRYRHGRCYAASRAPGGNAIKRMAFAAMTPLLPLVRVIRIWRHVQRVPRYHATFWRFLPLIVAAEAGWSWGEFCGYLSGPGGCQALLD